jgi:arylsulfatase
MTRQSRRNFIKSTGAAGIFSILGSQARAQAAKQPNILLVFPDQLRYDWTGLNPSIGVRTPNLVRLAEEGARFDCAFCPSPLCAPSRACLAQGKAYGNHGVWGNEYDNPDGVVTFYQMLRDAGYRVGSTGKLDLRKASHDWGVDGMHRVNGHVYFNEWGFTDGLDSEGKGDSLRGARTRNSAGEPVGTSPYIKALEDRKDGSLKNYLQWWEDMRKAPLKPDGYSYITPVKIPDAAYNDNWVGQNAFNLIENFPKNKPWFLQVNFPGPHSPMDITESMAELYKDKTFVQPVKNDQLPPEIHVAIRRNYSAMVENIDSWLGKYLAALEKRGELDNTVVVFSSDHGEMLGDHNRWAKTVPYHPSAAVPMVMRGPGIPKRWMHSGPTATLDLTATFLDYANLPVPASMDSKSLRPLLQGSKNAARAHATSGLKEWRLVCDGRYKLVQGFDTSERDKRTYERDERPAKKDNNVPQDSPVQLFDLEADQNETTNLAEKMPEIVEKLSASLAKV